MSGRFEGQQGDGNGRRSLARRAPPVNRRTPAAWHAPVATKTVVEALQSYAASVGQEQDPCGVVESAREQPGPAQASDVRSQGGRMSRADPMRKFAFAN